MQGAVYLKYCHVGCAGERDRNAMLAPSLLKLLRTWWQQAHRSGKMLPGGWLFPGMDPVDPLSTRQLNRFVKFAADAAKIDKRVSMDTSSWIG